MAECNTRCKILYKNHLSQRKWRSVSTIAKPWLYFGNCNRKRLMYHYKKKKKTLKYLGFKNSLKQFLYKCFMIATDILYNARLRKI